MVGMVRHPQVKHLGFDAGLDSGLLPSSRITELAGV